jgi:NAD(P)-dependent dehydrogenase (short-subunit alcohol dehydrogenase family)
MIAFRTPEQREERMKQVPMHRYGTPEEVAQLVAFLLSNRPIRVGRRSGIIDRICYQE